MTSEETFLDVSYGMNNRLSHGQYLRTKFLNTLKKCNDSVAMFVQILIILNTLVGFRPGLAKINQEEQLTWDMPATLKYSLGFFL